MEFKSLDNYYLYTVCAKCGNITGAYKPFVGNYVVISQTDLEYGVGFTCRGNGYSLNNVFEFIKNATISQKVRPNIVTDVYTTVPVNELPKEVYTIDFKIVPLASIKADYQLVDKAVIGIA